MQVTIKVNLDTVNPALEGLASTAQRRAELNQQMGNEVVQLTRDYLKSWGLAHPNKLGGRRTNYWGRAAGDLSSPAALEISEARALMNLNTPGLARAFGDVTIVPGTKTPGVKYLTIPAGPEAYGKKAPEFDNLVVFWAGGKRPAGLATGEAVTRTHNTKKGNAGSTYIKPSLVMFWFATSAFQPQDRTLLPADKEWAEAASVGAANFVDRYWHGRDKK